VKIDEHGDLQFLFHFVIPLTSGTAAFDGFGRARNAAGRRGPTSSVVYPKTAATRAAIDAPESGATVKFESTATWARTHRTIGRVDFISNERAASSHHFRPSPK